MPRTPMNDLPKILLVTKVLLKNKDKYLAIKRAPNDRYGQGDWDLPGGKMEKNESVKQSLVSEVREETGIIIKEEDISKVSSIFDQSSEHKKYKGYWYILMCFFATTTEFNVVLSEEHTDYKWVTKDELLKLITKNHYITAIKDFWGIN